MQQPVVYKVGDKVWLSTQCLIPPELRSVEHKIVARYSGPYTVIKVMSNATVRLELPRTSRAHSVVGVKDLKRFEVNEFPQRPRQPTLDPENLDTDVYEVEAIVGHKKVKRDFYFRVKWLGFPEEKDWTYEGLASFCDARGNVITTALREYVIKNKLSVPLDVVSKKRKRETAQ